MHSYTRTVLKSATLVHMCMISCLHVAVIHTAGADAQSVLTAELERLVRTVLVTVLCVKALSLLVATQSQLH
jgi:hypothetical protein